MTTIDNIPKYNKFSKETTELFTQMSEYLDTSLIFYGSILRHDYVKNKSDIDIAVFADNEYSMITKLSHFLRTHKKNFKKVLWKLNDKMVYGYKIKCNKFMSINCEIAIYNTMFKPLLLEEYNSPQDWSILVRILIVIIKFFHYTIPLLSSYTYSYYKRVVMNIMNGNKKSEFLIVNNKS